VNDGPTSICTTIVWHIGWAKWALSIGLALRTLTAADVCADFFPAEEVWIVWSCCTKRRVVHCCCSEY
jgi:hypothetical protein